MGGAARVAVCAVLRKEKARNPTVSTTPEKKEKTIKIFVSHRIDLDSQTIDNPLFVNVRCGAVFDKRKNVEMLGDDTGENISEKGRFCSELSVQYWAWKNQAADYYGLCHYRRYFAFKSSPQMVRNDSNQIVDDFIGNASKYGIDNERLMRKTIEKYDVIISDPIDVTKKNMPPGCKPRVSSVKELWTEHMGIMLREGEFELFMDAIRNMDGNLYKHAIEYINGTQQLGYCCHIMKREIYEKYNEALFHVLFQIEDQLRCEHASDSLQRSEAFFGEMFFGIYMSYLLNHSEYKVKFLPLVVFYDTEQPARIPSLHTSKKVVPVVLPASNSFIPYAACVMKSIINSRKNNYTLDFIVISKKMRSEYKKKLNFLCAGQQDVNVRFFDPTVALKDVSFSVAPPLYTEETYYGLLMPWLIEDYEKVIVLDSDIIVKQDIESFFDEDITEYCFGGVRDIIYQGMLNNPHEDWLDYAEDELNMKHPYDYVNGGVLLVNCKKMREEYQLKNLVNYINTHKMRIVDQDILNSYFQRKIKLLDAKYDFCVNLNAWTEQMLWYAPAESKPIYKKAEQEAVILHYANRPKPWENIHLNHAEDFWNVARETPFYEEILYGFLSPSFTANQLVCGEDPYHRFAFPWRSVRPGSRIVLYGGGIVGKMFLRQLANNPYCHVVAVCDQNPAATGIREAPVIDVRQLCDLDPDFYDLVLIDLERKDIATAIRADLELSGIPPQKIKWVDPHRR